MLNFATDLVNYAFCGHAVFTKINKKMKKIMMMAVALLMTVAASAQPEAGTFSIQPKVGMNISKLTKFDDSKAKVGFAFGVEGMYQISDRFGLSAGIMYSMQGVKAKGIAYDVVTDLVADYKLTAKMNYINIPILANFYVVKGLAVKAGIQPGFLVSKKWGLDSTFGMVNGIVDGAKIDGTKAFDFSIPVGISYEYANIVLDARYAFGLTKVASDTKSKNSVFQLTLGYKFNL